MSAFQENIRLPHEVSPELALVDPVLAGQLRAVSGDHIVAMTESPSRGALVGFPGVDHDGVRTAALRISELAGVNPLRRPRRRRFRHAGVAALWFEAVMLVVDLRLGVY